MLTKNAADRNVFVCKEEHSPVSNHHLKLMYLLPCPDPQMIVTDIYNHRFHRIFATNENLSSIMERDDIYV